MKGRATRAARAAAVLLSGIAAAGCCLDRAAVRGDRDTPERAFAFVRDAFAEDRTGDQYDSFHPEFRAEQGITEHRYATARALSPGTFAEAAALLRDARVEGPVERGVRAGKGTPLARITLVSPAGGRGVFVLADEPHFRLVTGDGEVPVSGGAVPDMARAVRVEGDTLVVELRARLGIPPLPGSPVHRVEIHHDWLLLGIESLEGFGEFLEEVRRSTEATPQ